MSVGRKQRPGRAFLEPLDRLFRAGTSVGLSDRQLLERFATRHDEAAEAAFAALVDRHGPMVLSVCRRLLHDPNDANDAFQATFLVLVRKAGAVRKRDSLASWLYGVARRVSAHSRAASIRRQIVERSAASARATSYEPQPVDRALWDEVDRLPLPLRTSVILCYLEGLTHEQASARLGWPVGTVRSRLARVREILRARLTRRGLAPGVALAAMLPCRVPALQSPLVESTVKAAMLFAARDAAEAGLVSASAAALTEGVLRIMFVSKLKTAAIALVAAGVVASNAGAYAYQNFFQPPADPRLATVVPDLATVVRDTDDPPSAKRLSDKDYETWRRQIRDKYKAKMQALLEQAERDTLDDQLEKAAATTSQIEATAREWRWMLNHPGAKSMPANARLSPNKPQVWHDTKPAAAYIVGDHPPDAAANPPRGGVRFPQPAAAPPPPTTGGPEPEPHPIPAPSPDNQPLAPVPPVPPAAPGALAAPVPGEPPPPPTMPDVPSPSGTPPPPATTHPGPAERLETLERKVDQILKALEQLHGANSNTRNPNPNRR